ncbi:MAG: hypothetical protein IJO94_06040 [Firmicutes bacterium]|nr:hypothetical protein [Bacillota bacterium]
MIEEIAKQGFAVKCIDGSKGMLLLPDKSIKSKNFIVFYRKKLFFLLM